MTPAEYPELFGVAVAARRRQLELSIAALHAAGGPTKPVVMRAERCEYSNPRPSTLTKFDKGLKWKPGTAAELFWAGVHPDIPARSVPVGAQLLSVPPIALERLLAANAEVQEAFRQSERNGRPHVPRECLDELERAVATLCAGREPEDFAASFASANAYREFALSLANLQHPTFSF